MEADVRREREDYSRAGVSGLEGWLILVQLGLFMLLPALTFILVTDVVTVLSDGSWEALTTIGSEYYHILWKPLFLIENGWNLVLTSSCQNSPFF